jgi:hypothetical protein
MGHDPLLSVGAVLSVLFIVLSILARRTRGGALGERAQRVMLTDRHVVHLVEIGGVRLLVGTGPSGAPRVLASLGEVEAKAHAAAEASSPRWIGVLDRLGVVGGR